MVNTNTAKLSKLESLSLSSSSSSSASSSPPPSSSIPSQTSEKEVPQTSSLATGTSLLPPRSPPVTTKTPYHPKTENPGRDTKIGEEGKNASDNGESQQQSYSLETILQRDSQHDQIKPPQHTRDTNWNNGKLANNNIDLNDGSRNCDAKIHEDEQSQHQTPEHISNLARHKRRVSWGGKLIQIPQTCNDNPMTTLFSERTKDRFIDIDLDNDNKDNKNHKSTRSKTASEIVSAIEASMKNDGIDTSRIINTKYQNHRRDESSASIIDMNDLAKLHPIESEAALGILKAIESQDRDHQDDHLQDDEQIEAVANLFTPAHTRLLDNVPEGAERIFQRTDRNISHVSSVTGNSTNTYLSETLIGSSKCRNDSLQTTSGRERIDSAQYSNSSAIEEATIKSRISKAGHNRTNTMSSYPTNTTTVERPLQQPNHNFDYRQRQHRRQETMEERLFSLNQALDAVDAPVASEQNILKRQDRELQKELQESTSNFHHVPSASMDLFNQNLARLFQDFDRHPENKQMDLDEKETIPLKSNIFGASAHPRFSSTSGTGGSNDQKEDKPVTEDASIHGFSMAAEHNSTRDLNRNAGNRQLGGSADEAASSDSVKGYQHLEVTSKVNDDIEGGILHPATSNVTTNDLISPSVNNGKKKRSRFHRFMNKIGLVHDMEFFFKFRTPSIVRYLKNLFWLVLVAIIVSAVMFYVLGNPPIVYGGEFGSSSPNRTCRYLSDIEVTTLNTTKGASYSWWILYLFVRLPITITIARSFEIVWIHFIILKWRWVGSCIGPTFTLLIVQAKGWPAILFFWSICNMCMLYGTSPFVNHWGYWQDYIELFNDCNTSGIIIASDINLKVQLIALVVSIIVAVKRLLIGFHQGRKTFLHYSEELSTLMTKILLISEISNLSIYLELEDQDDDELSDSDSINIGDHLNHFYKGKRSEISGIDNATQMLKRSIDDEEGVGMDGSQSDFSFQTYSTIKTNMTKNKLLITDKDKKFVTGLLSESQKRRVERLLGNWEEPENEKILTENVSIGAILQFRKSLSKLDSAFPFSYAFGKADTRDNCIQSSQNLYFRLLEKSPDEVFHFNILGLVALQSDGSLDQEKLKSVIKVFRPDRDGLLSLIDFVKSTDIVYKEMKLLRASVRSSQKIDKSFEKIFNILFYFVISCIILNVLGYDPIAVFLSLSSVVLAFSFMISQASSKYVEGLLFILYRRPYDIGDCIVIQPVDEPTSWNGSTEWIVRDINLFTTTVIFAYTNEIATLSNGSIANSRVMNGARSLPAIIYVTLRFGVDVGFEKLEIFREALSHYVDRRPREWSKLLRITSVNVRADEGFVEYLVVLQHVNNWQHKESVNSSRSQAKFFCHELSKQLDMRFKSPPLPVDLSIDKLLDSAGSADGNIDSNILPTISKMSAESDQIRNLIRDRRM